MQCVWVSAASLEVWCSTHIWTWVLLTTWLPYKASAPESHWCLERGEQSVPAFWVSLYSKQHQTGKPMFPIAACRSRSTSHKAAHPCAAPARERFAANHLWKYKTRVKNRGQATKFHSQQTSAPLTPLLAQVPGAVACTQPCTTALGTNVSWTSGYRTFLPAHFIWCKHGPWEEIPANCNKFFLPSLP